MVALAPYHDQTLTPPSMLKSQGNPAIRTRMLSYPVRRPGPRPLYSSSLPASLIAAAAASHNTGQPPYPRRTSGPATTARAGTAPSRVGLCKGRPGALGRPGPSDSRKRGPVGRRGLIVRTTNGRRNCRDGVVPPPSAPSTGAQPTASSTRRQPRAWRPSGARDVRALITRRPLPSQIGRRSAAFGDRSAGLVGRSVRARRPPTRVARVRSTASRNRGNTTKLCTATPPAM